TGRCAASLHDALRQYGELPLHDAAGDDERLLERPAIASLFAERPAAMPLRQRVLVTLPLVLDAGMSGVEPCCQCARGESRHHLALPDEIRGWDEWEQVRAAVVAAWFETIH